MQQVLNNLIKIIELDKKDKFGLYEGAFHALTGIFTGIALNDLWRVFNWPGNDECVPIKGQCSGYDRDFMYQTYIGMGIMLLELVGWKQATTFGASVIAGAAFANTSEKGRTIAIVPFA